jgi:hypothetical protein
MFMDYLRQNTLTDLAGHAEAIAAIPRELPSLVCAVQGLLIHGDSLDFYGLEAGDLGQISRQTLPVAARLDQILILDASPLTDQRPPTRRSVGTCRDYALMLCAFLRHSAIPARVRCGFARYFVKGRLEDHWVCEYWAGGRWRLADAQLDYSHVEYLAIDFDPMDLPSGAFLTSDRAWLAFQSGSIVGQEFGQGSATGPSFLHVNLARDLMALQGCEVSDWDGWRDALPWADDLDPASAKQCAIMAVAIADLGKADPYEAQTSLMKTDINPPFWQSH